MADLSRPGRAVGLLRFATRRADCCTAGVSAVKQRIALAAMACVLTGGTVLAAATGQATAAQAARAGTQAAKTAQIATAATASGSGPAAALAGMTLQQRVGQLFMAGVPATGPASSAISTDISSYHTGSVILTGR